MSDKNPEVMVCDAHIMKNVWEIRLREYGQRLKSEQDRIDKSALLRINEDWAKRMSGHVKTRRVERKAKPAEELPSQTFKPKQMPLGRPSGFVSSRPQRQADVKKDTTMKQSKLNLLLGLNEKQPGMTVWTKAWKFSQVLPQPEQMPAVSDWGTPWKFLNIQPKNEGKSWMDHERDTNDANNNITCNEALLQWEKVDKALYFQRFEEDLTIPDWEKSWKYTKQRKDSQGDEKMNLRQKSIDVFQQSQRYNEERSSSEWNESWKSSKPPNEEHVTFERRPMSKEDEINQDEEQSTIPWGQSWKQFKKQLHMASKSMGTSIPPAWMDSWRVSKPISPKLMQETRSNVSEPEMNMPEEPLDPTRYQAIMETSREEMFQRKMELWNSQFQAKDRPLPVNEWQKSWMTTKNVSEYKEQPIDKISREDKSMQPMQHQEMMKVGFGSGQQHGQFEVLPLFPKRFKPLQMTELSELSQDKEPFISRWKDSWKSLKNQRRQDRIQSRLERMPQQVQQVATPQTPLNEWTNSWRFTNLNLNQNSDLWQQGWSTISRNRPERWVRENDFPNNGPTSARGWGESWRSTRHQHRVEREATRPASTQRPSTQRPSTQRPSTQQPSTQPQPDRLDTQLHQQERREHSRSDWEQSWKFSMNQFHHDKPSSTEWADSWRFCSFHCEDWSKRQTEPNKGQWKSIEINGRKGLYCPSHMISSSFETQVFKERFPPKEWQKSWKMFIGKKQSKQGKDVPQSWDDSWMFNPSQLYQSSRVSGDSSSMQRQTMGNLAQYESTSEWGRSWRIANFQPPKSVALWFEAEPCTCSPTYMVFWSRYKCNDYLFSLLTKEYAKLRKWNTAWRFMKLESKIDMKAAINQTKPEDDSVIIKKVITPKKTMFSQVEKDREASYVKRWVDACKLGKTQPRPKRGAQSKPGQAKDEGQKAMFAEWAESWRFTSDSKTDEPVQVSVSLADWEDSWKFLLRPYPPQSSPKKTIGDPKGRS